MNKHRPHRRRKFGYEQRILIIAAEQAAWADFRAALQYEGYDVQITSALSKALWQILHKNRPDLIVMEMEPPDVDNFRLAQAIQRRGDIPIIVVSSSTDNGTIVRAIFSFAEDFIIKPIYTVELMMRIRRVLLSARQLASQPAQEKTMTIGNLEYLGPTFA